MVVSIKIISNVATTEVAAECVITNLCTARTVLFAFIGICVGERRQSVILRNVTHHCTCVHQGPVANHCHRYSRMIRECCDSAGRSCRD